MDAWLAPFRRVWLAHVDALERHLDCIVGGEAMKFDGWQRLNAEYARQFGIETPNWTPQVAQKS